MEQLALRLETRICQEHEMTKDEERVYEILRRHRGKESAVNQHRLEALTGINARKVRDIIKNLIERHRIQIASSYSGDNGGYYVPISESEIDETLEKLYGHALSILKRYSVFKKIDFMRLQKELF